MTSFKFISPGKLRPPTLIMHYNASGDRQADDGRVPLGAFVRSSGIFARAAITAG